MDLFQHRYYRLSKTLMTLIGQWPYQNKNAERRFLALFIFLIIGIVIPHILAAVRYCNNGSILLDSITAGLIDAICLTKLIVFMQNTQKTLKLLNRIRTDWQVWASDQEVNILHEYAEQGEKMTILYTAMIYSTLFVVLTQPIVPKIMDIMLRNGTEPGVFPSPAVYYNFDEQEYYIYFVLFYCVCSYLGLTFLVTNDVMLIIYVQHVCGLFTALGHKLERTINNNASVDASVTLCAQDKRGMVYLASCIERHNDAIEYANHIEASYAWSFFFSLGFGVMLINATGIQILTKNTDPEDATRFIALELCIVMHFYMECYISEILTDHSTSIGFYIHNSQWYRLSLKPQKLLQFMTMRCSVPCQLTAGKMFIMSFTSFGLVTMIVPLLTMHKNTLRAAISYFAFIRSTQAL